MKPLVEEVVVVARESNIRMTDLMEGEITETVLILEMVFRRG